MHLFEFMDLQRVPSSLRDTLRDIMECMNSVPYRPYYRWVATEVAMMMRERSLARAVELGAGTAPVTRELANKWVSQDVEFVPCDGNPDTETYKLLSERYPQNVKPVFSPVDFSKTVDWPRDTLLCLSATLHHVPKDSRTGVLEVLVRSGDTVLIFEPLRHNLMSMAIVLTTVLPSLLLPLRYLHRPGRLRRCFWCWLVPVAPLMFVWDGWVSCHRQWREDEWQEQLKQLQGIRCTASLTHSMFCQMVKISHVRASTEGNACGQNVEPNATSCSGHELW